MDRSRIILAKPATVLVKNAQRAMQMVVKIAILAYFFKIHTVFKLVLEVTLEIQSAIHVFNVIKTVFIVLLKLHLPVQLVLITNISILDPATLIALLNITIIT